MGCISVCASILLSFTLIFHVAALEIVIGGGGIIIGGGGGSGSPPSQSPQDCPPPPPTPCPPPPSPPPPPPTPCPPPPSHPPPPPPTVGGSLNQRLIRDLGTILMFKAQLLKDPRRNDPLNISANWIPGGNPCYFKGFNCSLNPIHKFPGFTEPRTLSDVQFNGYKLRGRLNGFIDKLKDISIFHANSNNFLGEVPPITAAVLPFLFELDLSNNKLSGKFPTQVLEATNLTFLDIRFNAFVDKVPPKVFLLDVDVLFINNNNFFQCIPPNLGSTPALYLTLANNKLVGPIPDSIGKAQKTLLEVLFLNNQLSGCLPWQIGLLKLARVFDVSQNNLQGPIPSSFACLENMKILNMRRNLLDGVVPEMLCALPNLSNLTLSYNYFTEVGPKCRSLIYKKVLDISMNCIRDLPDQRDPGECGKFFSEPKELHCPYQYLHAPCKAATYGNSGGGGSPPIRHRLHRRRRTAEVGAPVLSATYGALNHQL